MTPQGISQVGTPSNWAWATPFSSMSAIWILIDTGFRGNERKFAEAA
jgi:hypothetical protein